MKEVQFACCWSNSGNDGLQKTIVTRSRIKNANSNRVNPKSVKTESSCYRVENLVSKFIYLEALIGCRTTVLLPALRVVVRLNTKQNSIWSKAMTMPLTIMELCLVLQAAVIIQLKLDSTFRKLISL